MHLKNCLRKLQTTNLSIYTINKCNMFKLVPKLLKMRGRYKITLLVSCSFLTYPLLSPPYILYILPNTPPSLLFNLPTIYSKMVYYIL